MGQPARMRRHHIVDIPRFSRIRHRCEDSPESENLAKTCPDARYSEKSLNISRQKGESESFSESNLNISPNRRGGLRSQACRDAFTCTASAKTQAAGHLFRPAMRGNRHPAGTSHPSRASHALRRCEALRDGAATRTSTKRVARNRTFKIRHRRRATRTCAGQTARGVTSLS